MVLFILLALDCAGTFHGDISSSAAALIAFALAIVGLVLELRGRRGAAA